MTPKRHFEINWPLITFLFNLFTIINLNGKEKNPTCYGLWGHIDRGSFHGASRHHFLSCKVLHISSSDFGLFWPLFWPLVLAGNTLVTLCLAFGLYYYYFLLVCMCMMLRTQGFVVYWALHNSVMSLVGIVLLLTMAVITKFCPKNRDVLFSFLPNEIWFET